MEHKGSWDKNLPWSKFSYNNSYQETLKMAPFEVLYGCRCHTPLNCIEPGERVIFGPDIVNEAKAIVHRIQDNLKAVKSHQECPLKCCFSGCLGLVEHLVQGRSNLVERLVHGRGQ
jgi:hypothetical protein